MTDVSTTKTKDPVGAALADRLLRRLFPICRSITGPGLRQSLGILAEELPLAVGEVPSGEQVFDWIVPDEWSIRDAYIAAPDGRRVIDFNESNLHVVSYSEPVAAEMSFEELRPHLHTLPDLPDAIPYRTSYYKRAWGFCLSQRQLDAMDRNLTYTVRIDSTLSPGRLNYGETYLPGTSGREYLISTYLCHPSLANDNLSGPIATVLLYKRLAALPNRRHAYRFVFVPETIGAIAYMSRNAGALRSSDGGFVVTTCGGPGPLGYKETFLGDHVIDRAIRVAFRDKNVEPVHYPFKPDGSDERQYSAPGFRIPVATVTKDKYHEYPYYHTSLDDLSFVTGSQIAASVDIYWDVLSMLERDERFAAGHGGGEVQLGRRGLYPSMGGAINQFAAGAAQTDDVSTQVDRMTWVLFLADGEHTLLDVAERSGHGFEVLCSTYDVLRDAGVIAPVETQTTLTNEGDQA